MQPTRVTSKGQVTIPKELRQQLGIRQGSRIQFLLVGDIEFADALHHACCKNCTSVATFDDRKFARRAKKLGLVPVVMVPA